MQIPTATKLIYEAAMATGTVATPRKTITYTQIETVDVADSYCWLCGGATNGRGVLTKKAIKPTFTDHPYARGQGSQSICIGCAFCLSRRELRNYSILASPAELQHPSRAEWREILLDPPEPPFVCCLAVSGQKHLTFKAPVNVDRQRFTVMLEEQPIHVSPGKLEHLLEIVEELYIYFTKNEIATGNYSQHRIKECGIRQWRELEGMLEFWRGRPLFELALFVAQKKEKPEVKPVEPLPTTDCSGKGEDKASAGQLTLNGI